MKATARIGVAHHHGLDVVVDRYAETPFAIRCCGDRTLLASTAAAPLGGDELTLDIGVGQNATASIGSVAAMMIWPGHAAAPSSMSTHATIADGGHLDHAPEPSITVDRSHHQAATRVDLADTATCRFVEEYSLGRCGEAPGRLDASLRVTRGGVPLIHHDESFGAGAVGSDNAVGSGAGRHIISMVLVGIDQPGPATIVSRLGAAARLPVACDACLILAVGSDRPTTQAFVDQLSDSPR